ncbi:MAG: DNA polymerase III subunit delta' [Microbacteriaceae bacterium]
MSLWDELVGQSEAAELLRAAANNNPAHAWLIVGPPGSGRSNLAYAFAAELLDAGKGDAADRDRTRRLVENRSHPDLSVLSTDRVIITIDEVRRLVAGSYYAPSSGRYRIVVVEDADRMSERTSNVMLKALEEPPDSTIWILCAPSEADLLPTIKSRVRTVRLRIPSSEEVAALITKRDGVDASLALEVARQAQNHVGMAHRLATSVEARERRDASVRSVLAVKGAAGAVFTAAELFKIAEADAKDLAGEQGDEERAEFFRMLGLEPGQAVPMGQRAQLRDLEEGQKRRATRNQRDAIDRILVDILGLLRDALSLSLGIGEPLINAEYRIQLEALVGRRSSVALIQAVESVELARKRLSTNAAPLLILEAMLVGFSFDSVQHQR